MAALDYFMKQQDVGNQALADEVGYSRQSIHSVVKRNTKAGRKLQNLIAEAFNYTLSDFEDFGKGIVNGESPSEALPRYCTVDKYIVGLDELGEARVESTGTEQFVPREYLEALNVRPSELSVFEARDDSMAPHISQKSLAFIALNDRTIQSGKGYLVRIGEELTLRMIESVPTGLRVFAHRPEVTSTIVNSKDEPGFKVLGKIAFVFQAPTV